MDFPQTKYARSKEGNVAYQVIGDGPGDLVFIPWWATNVEIMWEEPSIARFLNRLAGFSRLICFDKRGAGVSDPVPLAALPTLEQWSDDVRTVMEAAGSRRAALLGFAHGGQMAMLFAATYPHQTSALILLDSFACQFGNDNPPWSFSLGLVPHSFDEIEELWGTGLNLEVFAPRACHDERFRRWYGRYERLSLSPRMVRAVVASDFEKDLRGVLPAIRVPTLVLHRAGNRFIDVRHGRYLAEHIPGAKLVELPGDDHLFHLGETETMLNEMEEFLTGERPVPEIDRVLATVLFTDIVASTERAAALGDHAWRSLLDAHHDVARRELERHRGREVEFVGDGLLATFDGPARAIRCACAIADAERVLGIEIRAGLHTGEIELAGSSVRGIAVHIGARVAAEAGPGEVLVSSTVKDLVAGSGLRFVDCGLRVLKGVPDEWRLYRVDPHSL
ncbi:MAG: adenylate/guanylate cyclase domain-containing protein [Candidatus Binatia bacterium]